MGRRARHYIAKRRPAPRRDSRDRASIETLKNSISGIERTRDPKASVVFASPSAKFGGQNKKIFRGSLVDLLDKRDCLEDVVEVCRAIGAREVCPKLVKLFEQPPQWVDGHRVWVEGFRRTVLHALGDLACDQSLPFLRRLMKIASSKKRPRRRYLEQEGYGVAIRTYLFNHHWIYTWIT